ncbi:MAG TPA: nicotinate-nucleotide--dimethylbenzimidazole phosphoribosyltransferase [Candidatus Saccharimonadales bacterium]|nr:nicotinate-nucleotide--dimethylbenzimidazole phosphoribosyltransferase [Candidatus Saccharimonadales bacterium]
MSTPTPDRLAATLSTIDGIGPLDTVAMTTAGAHLDALTKPPGSLGRLEAVAIQLAGITGRADAEIDRRALVIAAGDHGVTAQGVSAYPSEVTSQMVANFVAGGAAINVLAAAVGASVTVVDVGVAGDLGGPAEGRSHGTGGRLIRARVRAGTADMSQGPAMTRAEASAAIEVGLTVVDDLRADGVELIGIGEMGIGNTTAASALTAVLTGRPPRAVTGRGTGVDEATWAHKVAVVERAIAVNAPDTRDPLAVLAAIGGLEIAALVGVILGAVAHRLPIVLDGFITGSAVLVAAALAPAVPARVLAGHRSVEPGHDAILEHLGLEPLLQLDLRLGEGTGAALAIGLIDAAVRIRDGMATFSSAAVSGPAVPTGTAEGRP